MLAELGLCFVDKRTRSLLYQQETGHGEEEVTGNVDVVCRQMAPQRLVDTETHEDRTETDTRGWRGAFSFSMLMALVPITGAMTEHRDYTCRVFRSPAKKLVRYPKESTN